MTKIPANLENVDWSQTSFEGARREQLRAWSRMPLDRVIAALEEMSSAQADNYQASGEAVLTEVLRRIVATYAPVRVYLFGSVARGEADADSDLDLLIVVPDDSAKERRSGAIGYDALWGIPVGVDLVVWTRGAFERRARVPASLPATVLREGRLLHAA
jgi:predicted nucleotidyltransferase